MKETVIKADEKKEYFLAEGCHILEMWNSSADPEVSIARARVRPGTATLRHRLRDTVERYVIVAGTGLVEVGDLPATEVAPGDVVVIPRGVPQRITNTGPGDLIFLCICTPRFVPGDYENLSDPP